MAQLVKNLHTVPETWVHSLGGKYPLEKGTVTHSSVLAWRISWTVLGVAKRWTRLSEFHTHFQLLSHVRLFATPWTAAHQASLSFTISWSVLEVMSIALVMPSKHLILCHPISSCPQSFPASGSFPMSQLFSSGGQSIGASVSASIFPMNIQG